VLAPPLDILKKTVIATENFIGKKDAPAVERRASRYWFVLIELNVLFYQNYGDARPRYMTNIYDAVAVLQSDKSSVRLNFPDKRSWLFEFSTTHLAKRFEFSVFESRKHKENGSSVYIKGGSSSASRYEDTLRPFF